MLDWKLFRKIIFGEGPPLPSVIRDPFEELHPEGLTMGTLIIGRQGSGKTSSLAGLIVERAIQDSGWTAFVLDFSGSDSDGVLTQTLRLPQGLREHLKKRIVFDDLGNPDWVIPFRNFPWITERPMKNKFRGLAQTSLNWPQSWYGMLHF